MADLTKSAVPAGECRIDELLSAYLDGELRPGELDQVVEHLGDCLDCILEFRRLKEARAAVRLLPRLEVPEHLVPSVHYGPELSAYLDGELPTQEHAVVVPHLGHCADCRGELHELDAARMAVRSLPRVEPPDLLDIPDLLDVPGLRYVKDHRDVASLGVRRWRVASWAAGAAAAAALAIAVTSSSAPVPQLDLDTLDERHAARTSVDPGFSVIPAVFPSGANE